MKIIFTICSNNYLAQAKVLLDSVNKYQSDAHFIIGLVDSLNSEIDYSFFIGSEIITCDTIGIPDFDSLWKKFNIIELNTAVKPFFIEYFFKKYHNVESVIYFDPDIAIFQSLDYLYDNLKIYDILLTPHILTPIDFDGKEPFENLFLNYGLYNLGFIALKNTNNVSKMLKWWGERTYHLGFINPKEGIFVDQLWINFVPSFFDNIKILNHFGCNAAPWNLHERIFSETSEKFFVNHIQPLIFYHFSSYKPQNPNVPFTSYLRFSFENRPDLVSLYQNYHKEIILNKYDSFLSIPCVWVEKRKEYLQILEQERLAKLPKRTFLRRGVGKIKRVIRRMLE